MKVVKTNSTLRLISIFVLVFFTINLSSADDLYTWKNGEKPDKKYSDWSFSFYLAAAFSGQIVYPGMRMRTPGIQDQYNFSTAQMLYSVTTFEPKSWMIQVDYRMMKWMGMGFLFGNSILAKGQERIGPIASDGRMIEIGNSVRTLSLLLTIYLGDYVVLGIGPTYNMTDAPSNNNRIGLLAQMNIRIPLDERFSVNGIIQYRYVGITEIGPYTLYSADEFPTASITASNNIYPETQINYSHVFVGLGMSLYFVQK